MTRRELLKDIGVPVFTTMLGVFLGFGVSRIPKNIGPAELRLERVFVSTEENSEFGVWKLTALEDAKELWGMEWDEYSRNSLVEIHSSPEFEKNDSGIDIYDLEWRAKVLPQVMNITDDLKKRIKESENFQDRALWIESDYRDYLELKSNGDTTFEWNPLQWNSLAVDYIATQIGLPKIRVIFRNTGEKSATIYGLKCKNVYSFGGEAGAGGGRLEPANMEQEIILNWDRNSDLVFNNPLVVDPNDTVMLQFSPLVKWATRGDGPGNLVYKSYIMYHDGDGVREHYVGAFNQRDTIDDLSIRLR
jgi:hypothetical protein